MIIIFIQFLWVHALLIRRNSDVEINLGPKPNPCRSFSIFYWAYILDVNWVTYLRGHIFSGRGGGGRGCIRARINGILR